MGWQRRGIRRYFYTWVRIGAEYRKVCYGAGPAAAIAHRLDRERKAGQADRAEAFREERDRHARIAPAMRESCRLIDLICRAALILGGYRQHDRGIWRRQRGTGS